MNSNDIQKYINKSQPELLKLAAKHFNRFIRERDEGRKCISCNSLTPNQAGHYYSAGHYPELKFNENNCHIQCTKCNMYLSGNLIEYRKGLVLKIGESEVEKLDFIVKAAKNTGYKWSRLFIIEIILKYKNK